MLRGNPEMGQYYFEVRGGEFINNGSMIELNKRGSEKFSWKDPLLCLSGAIIGFSIPTPPTVWAINTLTEGGANMDGLRVLASFLYMVPMVGMVIGGNFVVNYIRRGRPKLPRIS